MKLKILGTVSPYCKNEKNCPGYLISKSQNKVLLDCGNGITRNMSFPKDLENLVVIISHLHKDHYGDLLALGYASYVYKNLGYLKNKVKVYIPKSSDKVSAISGEWKTPHNILPSDIDNFYLKNFGKEQFIEFIPYDDTTKLNIGELEITFSKNPHPVPTYSIKIKDEKSTVVYSGDTGFNNNSLTSFAKDADLLICESTFLRGQNKTNNNHLYAYEAALIASDAGAQELLLTHFFPEIDKNLYVEEAKELFSNVSAAEEGKVLKIGGKK